MESSLNTGRMDPDQLLKAVDQMDRKPYKGHLKIFFGYAAGVGKTYAMLQAAHQAKERGIDTVIGYVEPHARAETMALAKGLEKLPLKHCSYKGMELKEMDIDAILQRKPQLVLVDELAHTNAPGCRHKKRYMDVRELLQAGIDVYTTLNVQHLESLCDTVFAITGIMVKERISDDVFDEASQVELVDIEPDELLERFEQGKVYAPKQAAAAASGFFTLKNLVALRETALRRCADRINLMSESARIQNGASYHTDEKILVCLSSSPSNAKIIRTAARMAKAFHGTLCALYVETPDTPIMSEADQKRLADNQKLALSLGASIERAYGEDIPAQIAQFAMHSGTSKIVLGRSTIRHSLLKKQSLTERLIELAPDLDIYIIPDQNAGRTKMKVSHRKWFEISSRDLIIMLLLLVLATMLSFLFASAHLDEANIITVYLLAVMICGTVTASPLCASIASLLSILLFSYFFAEPKFDIHFTSAAYGATFIIMLAAGLIAGNLAWRLKDNAKHSAASASRFQILFETSQVLQKADTPDKVLEITARQLEKLFSKPILMYAAKEESLMKPESYAPKNQEKPEAGKNENAIADWVLHNNKRAGAFTDTLSSSPYQFLSIRMNDKVFGVCAIRLDKEGMEPEETGMLLSILGESAMRLEMLESARLKEEAAILAKNEQMQANLLRSISHDLRTPLTSILGNAALMMDQNRPLNEGRKKQLLQDVYDDAFWLNNLVDNLLSITKAAEGRIALKMQPEMMCDMIDEALRHLGRRINEYEILVEEEDEFQPVHVDGALITQVLFNLIDNALKYTPPHSHITIRAYRKKERMIVEVADDGPGISDPDKKHIFESFYTAGLASKDGRRSLGLGLALCQTIVEAHGGTISVHDNQPKGSLFQFDIPLEQLEENA